MKRVTRTTNMSTTTKQLLCLPLFKATVTSGTITQSLKVEGQRAHSASTAAAPQNPTQKPQRRASQYTATELADVLAYVVERTPTNRAQPEQTSDYNRHYNLHVRPSTSNVPTRGRSPSKTS